MEVYHNENTQKHHFLRKDNRQSSHAVSKLEPPTPNPTLKKKSSNIDVTSSISI